MEITEVSPTYYSTRDAHMPQGKIKLSKEKRLHKRFSVEIPVKYRVMNEQKEIESFLERLEKEKSAITKNASLGGMHIVTDHALKKGSILQIDIMIPGQERILKTFAEVVWSGGSGGGIRFLAMKEDELKFLKAYLEKTPSSG